MKKYEKLRELLAQETFPHRYIHKFIGINSLEFISGVERVERAFPKAKRTAQRESAGKGEQTYLAITLELEAANCDEIIALIEATMTIANLKIIL